jgi:hypothetical protein
LRIVFALCKAAARQISPEKQEIDVEAPPGSAPAFAQVFARLCKTPRADPARPRERKIIFRVMAA